MLGRPTPVDPGIAALTFTTHLDEFWATKRPSRLGWSRERLDDLTEIIRLPARRLDEKIDEYFIKLGALYYDPFPPTVCFADPSDWTDAKEKSQWLPVLAPPPWFGLHPKYQFPDQITRQLVCFTFAAEYYMVDHHPPDSTIWKQGKHTVAATLNRLAEVLSPPFYRHPGDQP